MSRPTAKGWCPGAYQPMMSGDGLVVRIRPVLGEFSTAQAVGLCQLAMNYGSGMIDLTSRANMQIRGVGAEDHEALLQALNGLDLLPDDPALEAKRNIIVAPDWEATDDTATIAQSLLTRLDALPDLPAKFGFAIDCGPAPILQDTSADIRVERSPDGLIVRADGAAKGRLVSAGTAAQACIALAEWFANTDGAAHGRMKRHLQHAQLPNDWQTTAPFPTRAPLTAGRSDLGALYGAPFGQIEAAQLLDLIQTSGCTALRMTPWRLFITKDAAPLPTSDFITKADDPRLTIKACPGAPYCSSATVETRSLADQLAQAGHRHLHISGCSKGCAHPRLSDVTLIGRDKRFDLVRNGHPWDEPQHAGLTSQDIIDRIGDL